MSSYDLPSASADTLSGADDPEAATAGLERTGAELAEDIDALTGKTDSRTRARQALSTAKDKAANAASRARAAAPHKARQAGQVVRGNPKITTAAALLVVLAAAAGAVVTTRRRAAKARAARSPWSRLISQ
jgi:hypothetical protein